MICFAMKNGKLVVFEQGEDVEYDEVQEALVVLDEKGEKIAYLDLDDISITSYVEFRYGG